MNTLSHGLKIQIEPKSQKIAFLIEQLKLVAKQSIHYKHLANTAKTSTKSEYYKKKLGKNNQLAAHILVLLERQGVEIDKEVVDSGEQTVYTIDSNKEVEDTHEDFTTHSAAS